ncbi:hypothetical protein [Rugosimonospora africana]|uniref:hypothetical protein n=1 Tax=Rugosimonospora africana TaxID=556532 RepID=UPI001940BCA9|nr:hypothetical protein [Rugosimonospora africana]
MARDFDSELLESVAVRRRRMRDAMLFGALASRRSYEENAGKVIASIVIAGVVAAGCVGYSSIRQQIAKQNQQNKSAPAIIHTPDR